MFIQKTTNLTNQESVDSAKWFHIDADNQVVGRLATQIADILRGKNNPKYTPNIDSGNFVVVTNCEKIRFTGNKLDKKKYYWHTGYVGGIKDRTAREQFKRKPETILEHAVKGMLPKNSLGRKQLKKLKIFVGPEHTHEAQNPETFKPANRYETK